MKLHCLGSSSSGNCYIIENETEALILEAGKSIPLTKVKQALGFDVLKVKAALISHQHDDHAGRAKEYERLFPTYANRAVIEAKGLTKTHEISAGKIYHAGGFKILAFEAEHDVPTLGFVIRHEEMGNLLFLTDSFSCSYQFSNLNHILIECNYSNGILAESVENGLHPLVAKRVRSSHMELNTCGEVLKSQDLSKVYNILLLHLSDNNADADLFTETISMITGKPAIVATPGLEIELFNKPF